MGLFVATNTNTSSANGYTLSQGDELFVPAQTTLFATGGGFSGVLAASGGVVEDHGEILGNLYGINIGSAGSFATVVVGTDGSVGSYSAGGAAINVGATGGSSVDVQGQINADGGTGIIFAGKGYLQNSGNIFSTSLGISQTDTTAGDTFSFVNTETGIVSGATAYNASTSTITESINNRGLLRGNVTLGGGANDFVSNSGTGAINNGTLTFGNGTNDRLQNFGGMGTLVMGNGTGDIALNFGTIGTIMMGSGAGDYVGNAGRINGNVQLGSGANQVFDSTSGTIYNSSSTTGQGTITAGSGGDTIVGALNGGQLIGGAGNDVLIANQSTSSNFNYAATVTLDGKGGSNAMYGGQGNNVFMSGDSTYNQIWGGAGSFGGSGGGYANNTVNYSQVAAGSSVYVDLLNGHDAYIVNNGAYTYEDSIQNVPNVVGTSGADIIQCDNGVDRIIGGGGADALYAGSGAQSQDNFIYNSYADSNLVTGYDTIVGFKIGTDKIDFSAFHTDPSHLALSNSGTSNTVYLEQTPGSFNPNTDLAMVVNATTTGGLKAADFIF
jgi:hypothetical protein